MGSMLKIPTSLLIVGVEMSYVMRGTGFGKTYEWIIPRNLAEFRALIYSYIAFGKAPAAGVPSSFATAQ